MKKEKIPKSDKTKAMEKSIADVETQVDKNEELGRGLPIEREEIIRMGKKLGYSDKEIEESLKSGELPKIIPENNTVNETLDKGEDEKAPGKKTNTQKPEIGDETKDDKTVIEKERGKDLKLKGKIIGDKEVKGETQKQLSPEEIKRLEELEVKKSDAEKKLEKNRENYIKEYKKCKSEADRQKLIEKTRTTTFNILAGVKNIFSKNKIEYKKSIKPEDYFTDKTKEAKTEYTQACIEMGNVMFEKKKAELEKAGLSGKDLEIALAQYKATEILAKTIIDERQKIIDSKTVEKPALWKRLLDGYMKIKPRWKRVALSTLLFLPLSATGAIGASAIAAGGIYAGVAGLALIKFGASMAIGAGVGHLAKGIDWAKKGADLKFKEKQEQERSKMGDEFSTGKLSIEEYEKGIELIENEEKKRARNRMILKGVTGGALAMIAGFVAYDAMGHGIEHIGGAHNTIDTVSGPDVNHVQTGIKIEHPAPAPPIIQHANIEATADNGQGAISTLRELQHNLKIEYGNNLENAPASVKHILNTDPHKLAQEFGMYKPGESAESALIKTGSSFRVDESGNVTFHQVGVNKDILLEKGIDLKASDIYEGKMVDTDNSGVKIGETPHNTPVPTNEYKVPEQVDPITGEPIINTPHYEPRNLLNDEYKVPEQVDAETGNQIISGRSEIKHIKMGEEDNQIISGKSEIKHINIGTSLSTEALEKVNQTYEQNIHHLFPNNEHTYAWDNVKNKTPDDLFKQEKVDGLNEMYKPLASYLHKLEEITGLSPRGATILNPVPEINEEFIERTLQKAQEIGQLDKVKL